MAEAGKCDVCGADAVQRDAADNERCEQHRLSTEDQAF